GTGHDQGARLLEGPDRGPLPGEEHPRGDREPHPREGRHDAEVAERPWNPPGDGEEEVKPRHRQQMDQEIDGGKNPGTARDVHLAHMCLMAPWSRRRKGCDPRRSPGPTAALDAGSRGP